MKKSIDLRGLSCPEPVLRTKKLLDDQTISIIEALVDSEVNVQNLTRLARSQKRALTCKKAEDHFVVIISKHDDSDDAADSAEPASHHQINANSARGGGLVIFISKDSFGQGSSESDHDFSNNLLNVFLQTLEQAGHKPKAVLMANSGVKLMDPQGPHIKVLQALKEGGSEVLACGLCLDYYKLKEQVATEQITNMFTICEYLIAADQVISP